MRRKRPGRRGRGPRFRFLALCLLAAAAGGVWAIERLVHRPFRAYAAPSVLLEIPPGSSTLSILKALETGGILRDYRLGSIALRTHFRGESLKAGEYRFSEPLSPIEVLRPITAGDVVTWKVTVPEGLAAEEVFGLFAGRGFGTVQEFQRLFGSPRDFAGIPDGAPSLEGFLFPETYTLTKPRKERDVVTTMVREFRLKVPPDFDEKARNARLTFLGAVTMASLIEKETSIPDERPLVSAVFHNRLSLGMPLQCDPTTIYALKRLGRWHGPLTRVDLAVDDAYNTYVRSGLPPGPICSPGLPSLQAAVSPADSKALYFVAKGDGSHTFSESYEGQQRNVARFRKVQRAANGGRPARPR